MKGRPDLICTEFAVPKARVMPTAPAGADVSSATNVDIQEQELDGVLHIREAGALLETCEVIG